MNPKRLFLLTTCLAALAPATSSAQTFTWNGGGGDDNFTTGLNWGGTAPQANVSGQDLVFGGSTRLTPSVDAQDTGVTPNGFRADSITFAVGAGSFNIGGPNNIRMTGTALDGTDRRIQQNSVNNQTITTGVGFSSSMSGNPITIDGTGAGTLTLNAVTSTDSNAHLMDIKRQVSIGTLTAGGGIQVRSAAATTINTISGNFNSLSFGANNASNTLGSASGTGTLRMGLSEAASLFSGTTFASSSTQSYSNMGVLFDSGTFGGSSANSFGGSFNLNGNGNKTLAITNTGGTTFSGTAQLGATNGTDSRTLTIDVGSGAQGSFTGQVTGSASSGTTTITKIGTGTLVLADATNNFDDGLNINAGTVESQAAGALGAGTVTVGTSGTLRVSTVDQSLTIGGSGLNLALSGANSTLDVTAGRKLTLSRSASGDSTFTKTGSGTLELGGANSFSLTAANTNVTIVEGSVNMNRSGGSSTFGGASSTPNITIGTAGTVTSATLKAEAATDPFAGKPNLTINHLGTLDLNGRSATATSITMTGGTIQTGAGTISLGTVAGTNLQYTGSTNIATISGNLALGGVLQTISVADGAAAVDLDISANIAGGVGSIDKTGSGTLRLTGNNGYSGGTTVTDGALLVNNTTGSGTGSGAVTVNGGTLGGSGSIAGTLTVNSGGTLAPGASIGTLSVGGNTAVAGTYSCEIDGTSKDVLAVTGDLNVSGTLTVVQSGLGANQPSYVIATCTGTLSGTLTLSAPVSGYTLVHDTTNKEIRLDASGGASFASWASGFSAPPLSNTAANADPDNDGLANSLEYVLGTDPRYASQSGLTTTAAGSNLVLTFNRKDSSETADVSLAVLAGIDLVNWPLVYTIGADNASSSAGVSVNEAGPSDTDIITVTIPKGADPKKFARLRVVITP